jgi:ribosomal protein L7/L12
MSDFLGGIILLVLVGLVVYVIVRWGTLRRLRTLQQKYGAENVFSSSVDGSYIAFDVRKKCIALAGSGGSSSSGTSIGIYDFAQVSSAEIVSNGATLARVSRAEEVGSSSIASLQRVAAGINSASMHRLGLRVNVNDLVYPTFLVQFVFEARPIREKPVAEEGLELTALRSFYDRLRTAIGQTEAALPVVPPSRPCAVSIISARNPIHAGNVIRELRPDLGFAESKQLVENLPAVVMTGVDFQEAERLRSSLALQGIGVSIT